MALYNLLTLCPLVARESNCILSKPVCSFAGQLEITTTLGEPSVQFVTSQRANFQRLLQHTLKSGTAKMTFYWDCWEVDQSNGSVNFAQDLRGLQLSNGHNITMYTDTGAFGT